MKKPKKTRKNPALDLFGGVVITRDEVELWLDRVALLPRDSPRRRYYCESWDVHGKIKAAKLDGTFDLHTQ
jgi:hypothetical protein